MKDMRFYSKYRKDSKKRSESASKAALARWTKNPPRQSRPMTLKGNGILQLCQILGLHPETEYKFHTTRRWRFDFSFPQKQIALEYEGIFSAKSRHTSIKGFIGDCDKYNEAQKMGWSVFRITAVHVQNGKAFEILEWIKGRLKNEN